jgi:tetratricopeptide (TPR) repeat protein
MRSKILLGVIISALFSTTFAFGQARKTVASAARAITIVTEPNASIWIDDILRGISDESGMLVVKPLMATGIRRMRVRANGFKEASMPLLPAQKGELKVVLVKTTDKAELAFQQAESESDRTKAAELYRQAIAARPKFAEAQLGLARVLSAASDTEGALKAIAAARRIRPVYAEASAVEGRIYKSEDNETKALASFKRSIAEGKGFQPEAHAGLGLLYKDKAEGFAASADFENEKANYALAESELKIAIKQLAGAPDAKDIYQLLGAIYEKTQRLTDAIALYEEFLRVFPDSAEATAVQSFIVQLKKQMSEEQP